MDDRKKIEKKIAKLHRINEELEEQVEQLSRDAYHRVRDVQDVYDALRTVIIIVNKDGKILQSNSFANNHIGDEKIESIFDLVKGRKSLETLKNKLNEQILLQGHNDDFQVKLFHIQREENVSYLCSFSTLGGHSGERIVFVANEITSIKKEELKRAELQRQLMEQSFKEGMAENAISILHNIGNVLTGMIGTIESHTQGANGQRSLNNFSMFIDKLKLVDQQEGLSHFLKDENKSQQLLNFLENIGNEIGDYIKNSEGMAEAIKDKSQYIGEIISVQQQYAKLKKGIKTTLTLGQLLDDCLLINESKVSKPYIHIERKVDEDYTFAVEKNSFIQVLSNALVNAIESIEEKMNGTESFQQGLVSIHSRTCDKFLYIVIDDNGGGFGHEVKEKLFKFGFSTKKRSSGFGLHNCINFMKSQGGDYEIDSLGINQGAQVTIKIPI